ncbi:hypothetical protein [Spirillospora sp. NPDC029432]|uniref:hypothetical protein n=1 Tax=Spirillospora sp. NPDC029432 TaxID=3154599 RepID=UPI003456DFA0
MAAEIQKELERLSVVAIAMFNRGRQAVKDEEVDRDLRALLDSSGSTASRPPDMDERLTPAQLIVGRFFFVHESQASYGDTRWRTYEFLHATFGEYLTARLVANEIARLVRLHEVDGLQAVRQGVGRLRALLRFALLVSRRPIADFLAEFFAALRAFDPWRLEIADSIVGDLLAGALYSPTQADIADYAPAPISEIARCANLSANAVILRFLCAGHSTRVQVVQ